MRTTGDQASSSPKRIRAAFSAIWSDTAHQISARPLSRGEGAPSLQAQHNSISTSSPRSGHITMPPTTGNQSRLTMSQLFHTGRPRIRAQRPRPMIDGFRQAKRLLATVDSMM